MVQVDVFWSYGIGAGFAVANTFQLERQQAAARSPYQHTSFRDTVLYLGAFFVPSGAFLLAQFPSWETMHVATRDDIPGWLTAAFTATNFTQGVLGFAVAAALLRRRQQYAAYLQWVLGYFLLFFILVHGWDGTGYKRFLSTTRADFLTWTWGTGLRWVTEDVALSLMAMGAVMLPVMFGLMARDLKEGYALRGRDNAASTATAGLAVSLLAALLSIVLGAAILASISVRYLGWVVGVAAFAAVIYLVGLRPGGVFHRHFRHMIYGAPLFAGSLGQAVYEKRPTGTSL